MNPTQTEAAKVLLRLPHGLHDQLKTTAEAEGMSMNTLLVAIVAGSLGWTLKPPK
jgi:hypothetical protein